MQLSEYVVWSAFMLLSGEHQHTKGEGHKAWLELQLDLLQRLGEPAYSARFVAAGEDEGN